MKTSKMASTRYRVADAIRVAHDAPSHAPTRLPASRLTTATHSSATADRGTAPRRAGMAATTTTRLIALFTMTAARAANPNTVRSRGRRNSAPPRPIQTAQETDRSTGTEPQQSRA